MVIGARVGASVGESVDVGALVGGSVAVGAFVGGSVAVGALVGGSVTVGAGVGTSVGFTDGWGVGTGVGATVGVDVGLAVGLGDVAHFPPLNVHGDLQLVHAHVSLSYVPQFITFLQHFLESDEKLYPLEQPAHAHVSLS